MCVVLRESCDGPSRLCMRGGICPAAMERHALELRGQFLPATSTPSPRPPSTGLPQPATPPTPQTMLGAWDKNSGAGVDMASKLAQKVAANKLAHSYMAFNTNYHDTGAWAVNMRFKLLAGS